MRTSEMVQREEDRKFYIEVLKSEECQCERWKRQKMAFCWHCYKQLPQDMQRALYRRIGDGFEEAYEDAVKWLTA